MIEKSKARQGRERQILALVQAGTVTARELMAATGLASSHVYEALESLTASGVIGRNFDGTLYVNESQLRWYQS